MPTRSRIRRIVGGPQGDDAVIVIIVPTVGEMREQSKLAKAAGPESDEAEQGARQYLADHLLEWNWVNDEDLPFPTPHGNPDVFGSLTREELTFIGQSLSGTAGEVAENTKKLQKKS